MLGNDVESIARVRSFPPIARHDARLLILGSMPGEASLVAGQYYAHPRNAFWSIMGELLGFSPMLPYAGRVAALQAAGIAVWDVLQTCVRPGSLDSAIERESEVANDLAGFLIRHRDVRVILFNGGMAEAAFRRHLLPDLRASLADVRMGRLPSTSPANASWSFARKLAAWRAALDA